MADNMDGKRTTPLPPPHQKIYYISAKNEVDRPWRGTILDYKNNEHANRYETISGVMIIILNRLIHTCVLVIL